MVGCRNGDRNGIVQIFGRMTGMVQEWRDERNGAGIWQDERNGAGMEGWVEWCRYMAG